MFHPHRHLHEAAHRDIDMRSSLDVHAVPVVVTSLLGDGALHSASIPGSEGFRSGRFDDG